MARYNTMGYEIILIAHFVYVLVMYSLVVKEYQCLFPYNKIVPLLTSVFVYRAKKESFGDNGGG